MTPFTRTRWVLAGWNLAILALLLVATVGTVAIVELRAHDQAVERELRAGAEREAASFERDGRDEDERERFRPEAPDLFAFWVDAQGAVVRNTRQVSLAGLPDAAGLAAALRGREALADRDAGGVPVRLLSVPVSHDGRLVGAVQVGKSLAADRAEISQLIATLAATGLAGLLLAALGSVFLAGRAMRPIRLTFERQRQFIADASHELRTPVAVLRARAEALQRDVATLPPEAASEVRQLARDADELTELLGELLDLARLDAGQASLSLEPVALADVVEEAVAQLRPLADERAVQLQSTTTPLWAHANLSRVRQVIRALADNALKHTPPGGSVTLALAREGAWAQLVVRDTGEGIPPEQLPRVFDRFYRADPARHRAEGPSSSGAGLGLAIAQQLVRLMHGQVHLQSAPGTGTTATVLLPLESRQP